MGKVYYTPERIAENKAKAAPYKERRLALGLSQRQLAAKAGLDRCTIRSLENGLSCPCWETRQKVRLALDMPEERCFSVEERNAIFFELQQQEVIQWAIRRNMRALKSAYATAFLDDLYQDCAVCAIRAIDRFQPDGTATLKTFVERNVMLFMKRWIVDFCKHGLSGKLKYPLPDIRVYSLDMLMEEHLQLEG